MPEIIIIFPSFRYQMILGTLKRGVGKITAASGCKASDAGCQDCNSEAYSEMPVRKRSRLDAVI